MTSTALCRRARAEETSLKNENETYLRKTRGKKTLPSGLQTASSLVNPPQPVVQVSLALIGNEVHCAFLNVLAAPINDAS